MPRWKTAYASVVGTSHAGSGAPCQDAGSCEVVVAGDGKEVLLAAVADGAGSAPRSDVGAQLAVRRFHETFGPMAMADPSLASVSHDTLANWLRDLRRGIVEMAAATDNSPSDYACTFLAAVIGPSRAVYMQIGDGAIVVRGAEPGDYDWVFWPQHGEFANSTNFVTQDDHEGALEVEFVEGAVPEVAIFSDGIERLVLDIAARTVHAPALTPIFGWLAKTEPTLTDRGAAPGLVAFLSSERVNSRTDDDKTLVMATRSVEIPGG